MIALNDKLTREEVLHVAYLARLALTEEEITKFQSELYCLLNEVEKVNDFKGYDDERMFTPVNESAPLREDEVGEMLDAKEVLKNVPKKNGNFVEVPVMVRE